MGKRQTKQTETNATTKQIHAPQSNEFQATTITFNNNIYIYTI